ncbi:CDP-glycerol glycerophosphotransferase family protein [Thalassotalea maritima]|uniref:CDP-glycerol glycerophosphotransferase family protein n=1 Tax=Thalassotalea maritima TaxID=3242416 RepID=UPI003526E1FE
MKIAFDIQHLYYLPQYLPVINALKQHTQDITLVAHTSDDVELNDIIKAAVQDVDVEVVYVSDWQQALAYYLEQKPRWIVFGNAVSDLVQIHKHSKTILMQHGVGPKSCYYEVSKEPTTVRFVEGQKRLANLQDMYPHGQFVDTGYAKLDPAITGSDITISLPQLGLDPKKPTLLYAPTYYPSSIELFADNFPEHFAHCNIIIKPHFFSLTKAKYHKQKALLNHWSVYKNVYVATVDEYNLLPFMALSDVMLSDASSAIFEFAALDKPVIWCDFYKLRWSYRGIFSFRFKKRLDASIEVFHQLCERASNFDELANCVKQSLEQPNAKSAIRNKITEQYVGRVDGQCAQRIVEYILAN